MATAVFQGATGNPYIDGVLSGAKWSGSVTYSFPNSPLDYPAGYGYGEPSNQFAQLSLVQQQAVQSIMTTVANYTNLTVQLAAVDSTADIRLAKSDEANPTAYAYYPSDEFSGGEGGDIWFGDVYNYVNPVLGSYEYLTHIHEIGHAFGLKHGHETGGPANVAIPANHDDLEYTVMTYRSYLNGPITGYTNGQWGYPQTFMMSDIAALQTMYGADYTYRSGDTVYSWLPGSGITYVDGSPWLTPGGNRIFLTVWDGGGIDTYDFSAYSTSVTIDLGPGDYSIGSQAQLAYLGGGNYAHGNVYNAYLFQGDVRSYIENAIGGSGDDFIYGNDISNVLTGNGGNDSLDGGLGIDTLIGGLGNDIYVIDNVNDVVTENSGQGTDWAYLSVSGFTLPDNVENLALLGSANLTATGNGLDNNLYSNTGVDTLIGGDGNDTYLVHNTADQLIELPNQGIDIVYADVNFTLPDNVESLALIGSAGLNGTGNSGDNTLYGNSGVDTFTGGLGNDIYVVHTTSSQVVEQSGAGSGTDVVYADVSFTLPNNVEILALYGSANLNGTGNGLDNVIYGNSGVDTLIGGLGNDSYVVHNSATQVVEQAGQGTDIVFADANFTLPNNVEVLVMYGASGRTGTGNGLDNVLYDVNGGNTLMGGFGNDAYVVSAPLTVVTEQLGQGTDIVFASVSYTLPTNVENLLLEGSGAINGTGNAVDNVIYSNSGNNVLTGAGGSDSFVFLPSFGQDTITDFNVLNDHLYFDNTLFADIADLLAHTADNGIITDNSGNILILTGITKADLQAHTDVFFFV